MTSIRRAQPPDLPAVIQVGRQAWWATFGPLVGADYVAAGLERAWAPEVINGEIEAGDVLIAVVGSRTVGMASAKHDGERTLLSRLYLRPAYQGRGIGRLLLNVVLSSAPGPVALTVLSGNDRARAFYEAHGFREEGRVPDPDGGPDQVRMVHR